MKVTSALSLLSLAFVAAPAMAEDASSSHTPVDEVVWQQTPIGPEMATVQGNTFAGPHVTLIRFKAGMKTPVHTHTASYSGVVVAGRSKHFEPGKPETEKVLAEGAFWFIRADVPHISECLEGEDCIFAVTQAGAFDFHTQE